MQLTTRTKIATTIALLLSIAFLIFYMNQKETELPTATTQAKKAEAPSMSVQEKKEKFRGLIVPAVNNVYANLMKQYVEMKEIIDAGQDSDKLEKLKLEYKVTTNSDLLMALKPHPRSIAVAQAAMESSWATSRFFREANNIFGVWSFDENEPRIAALKKRGDKTIWVKKYSTVEEAIYDYYRTLARSSAFAEFREIKMTTNDPFALVKKLDRYSEKGSLYAEELTAIIKFNKFNNYDKD